MKTSERLTELGIKLPPPAAPVGSYLQAKVHERLIFVTGQLAFVDGVITNLLKLILFNYPMQSIPIVFKINQ